jgi:hypothetical protein
MKELPKLSVVCRASAATAISEYFLVSCSMLGRGNAFFSCHSHSPGSDKLIPVCLDLSTVSHNL